MSTERPRKRSSILLGVMVTLAVDVRAQESNVDGASCVEMMNDDIRYADEIVLLPIGVATAQVAKDAIQRWQRCYEYESAFPRFVVGDGQGRRVKVYIDHRVPGPGYCGSFVGDAITLYRLARVDSHRILSCPSADRVLAHELGHVLGLRDVEGSRGCPTFMMSEVVERRPALQRVGRDECRAVDRKWVTSEERDAAAARQLAAAAESEPQPKNE